MLEIVEPIAASVHAEQVEAEPNYFRLPAEPEAEPIAAQLVALPQHESSFDPYNVPEDQLRAWAPPIDASTPAVWPLERIEASSQVTAIASVSASTWQADAVDGAFTRAFGTGQEPVTEQYFSTEQHPVAELQFAAEPHPVAELQFVTEARFGVESLATEQQVQAGAPLTRRQLRELVGPLVSASE